METPLFIEAYQMSDTKLCDDIIEYYESIPNKTKGHSSQGYNPDIKDSIDVKLGKFGESKILDRYVEHLFKECLNPYIEKYPDANTNKLGLIYEPNIQWYPKGGGYKVWHSEKSYYPDFKHPKVLNHYSRHLVYLTYLNDVVGEGGETEFLYQNFGVKPKKGMTVIFPAEWMFTHKGVPAVDEEKMIITSWIYHLHQDMPIEAYTNI